MRYYSFTNFMLSSIQQGIQSNHACAELFVKYQGGGKQREMLYDWATNYKTIVCLNGGNNTDLQNLLRFFEDINNPYPYAAFYENEQTLNGTLTSVGIVLPAKIYDSAYAERNNFVGTIFRRVEEHLTGVVYDDIYTRIAGFTNQQTGLYTEHWFTDWEYEMVLRLNNHSLAK